MSHPRSHHTTPIFRCSDFMCSHSSFLISSISLCLVVAGSRAVGMQASNDHKQHSSCILFSRSYCHPCTTISVLVPILQPIAKLISKNDHSLHGYNNYNYIIVT